MTFNPGLLGISELRLLRDLLVDADYRSEWLAADLGLTDTAELLGDIARNSLFYSDSLGDSPPAVLGKLFLLCTPVPSDTFATLPAALSRALLDLGLAQEDTGKNDIVGTVTISEFGGYYYLADRLFENRSGIISMTSLADKCMPPHASSLELMRTIEPARGGSAVLDVGCGSGFLSFPLAGPTTAVTGIDISSRAVAFAQANASLNSLAATIEQTDWKDYAPRERYDHIIFNSPDEREAFRFVNTGIPRLLAAGGYAQVWLWCDVPASDGDIQETVARVTSITGPFDLLIKRNDDSPFSLSREAVTSGRRPPDTLLVRHPSEWRGYVDSLRDRGVAEVSSVVLEVRHAGSPA